MSEITGESEITVQYSKDFHVSGKRVLRPLANIDGVGGGHRNSPHLVLPIIPIIAKKSCKNGYQLLNFGDTRVTRELSEFNSATMVECLLVDENIEQVRAVTGEIYPQICTKTSTISFLQSLTTSQSLRKILGDFFGCASSHKNSDFSVDKLAKLLAPNGPSKATINRCLSTQKAGTRATKTPRNASQEEAPANQNTEAQTGESLASGDSSTKEPQPESAGKDTSEAAESLQGQVGDQTQSPRNDEPSMEPSGQETKSSNSPQADNCPEAPEKIHPDQSSKTGESLHQQSKAPAEAPKPPSIEKEESQQSSPEPGAEPLSNVTEPTLQEENESNTTGGASSIRTEGPEPPSWVTEPPFPEENELKTTGEVCSVRSEDPEPPDDSHDNNKPSLPELPELTALVQNKWCEHFELDLEYFNFLSNSLLAYGTDEGQPERYVTKFYKRIRSVDSIAELQKIIKGVKQFLSMENQDGN